MNLNPARTVKDVALGVSGATRIFEKLGIDYCCGGNRTLGDACRLANRSFEEVVGSLAAAAATPSAAISMADDWQQQRLAALSRHIVETHHTFTRNELTRLEHLLDKVCSVHAENHAELGSVQRLFEVLKADLLPHMLKEEKILFPYVEELEMAAMDGAPYPQPFFGSVQNPVQMMMNEHDAAGDLLRQLRDVTSNYTPPADACISYRTLYQALADFEADLHQHIHLENNLLFPRAVEMEAALAAA